MKTKRFRVAVEGATTDGRAIDKKWLTEMAATYNRDTYAARINLEHVRGITADEPFLALGDVLSLSTEEIELDVGGKKEKRTALFAELDVLDPLVAMNRKGQKLYTSIEVNPNFATSGKAYLMGLAVTDSPASLGTEMLTFAAQQGDKSPLAARKHQSGNLFTAAQEATIELVEDPATDADPTGVFASIKKFIDGLGGHQKPAEEANPRVETEAVVAPATDPAGFAAIGALMTQMATAVSKLATDTSAQITALTTEIASVKTTLEATPAHGFVVRPVATGGDGGERTDC